MREKSLRIIATAPTLPKLPCPSMESWGSWVSSTVETALARHEGDGTNMVLLPEIMNLPVITAGGALSLSIARKYIHRPKVAMVMASRAKALWGGFPSVLRAQINNLVGSREIYRKLANQFSCYLLGSGYFIDEQTHQAVNRAWVINSNGDIVHIYDKQHLMPGELSLGLVAGRHNEPCFEVEGIRLATVICLDMFIPEVQAYLQSANVRAVLVPSANSRPWRGYTERKIWQPREWSKGSDWVMGTSTVLANPMLEGAYSSWTFEGQAYIRGTKGIAPCPFPRDRNWDSPQTGFYSGSPTCVFADIEE